MPELPEVENFARSLHDRFAGSTLHGVIFHRDDLRFPFDKKALLKVMHRGARLLRIAREGKQVCFEFDSGRVFASLGMSGHFVAVAGRQLLLHQHVSFRFVQKQEILGYVDPRRFGFFSIKPPPAAVSPLDWYATKSLLLELKAKGCQRRVRDALMDQKLLAGVGNIYMCEACYVARVNPLSPLAQVPASSIARLAKALAQILERAVSLGGSTIASYRRMDGSQGNAQSTHQVYGRAGQPCLLRGCGGTVERQEVGGRGVFLCPRCQNN